MSRQQASKRPKLDGGLALPQQSTGWPTTVGTPARVHTPGQPANGGLALPAGGVTGYTRAQWTTVQPTQVQQQMDPTIDPALQAAAYPQAMTTSPPLQRSASSASQPNASQPQAVPRLTAAEQAAWDEYVRKYYEYYGAPPPAPTPSGTQTPAVTAAAYQQQSTAAAYQVYQQRVASQQSQSSQSQSSQPAQQESQQSAQSSQSALQQPAYSQYAQQLFQQQQQQQAHAQYALPGTGVRRGRPVAQKPENKETINDALGSAGVDLRAEEDAIHRTYDAVPGSYPAVLNPRDDRTRKQTFIPPNAMMKRVNGIASGYSVKNVTSDASSYIALAAQAHISTLLRGALAASKNRQLAATGVMRPPGLYPQPAASEEDSLAPPLPMWSQEVTRDVGKQLAAIERVQRANELQARLKKREREDAANGANGEAGGEDDQPKKKKKKEGPGVAARNMSEGVRKRLSDAVAMRAAGNASSKYSWLQAGAAAAQGPIQPLKKLNKNKEKDAEAAPAPAASSTVATAKTKGPAGGWGRAYQNLKEEAKDNRRKVEVRDVIWAMEGRAGSGIPSGGEKGVGRGGRGGTRWRGWEAWSRIRE
ncbi:hypothetical protein DACRYDRAFT_112781 [Dacryopinax primogenitus]|uniref:Transcription initiation factor TFIID subunit 4 n=1 Tax=Dacryopinax primogenitus (strain DJM 731) TaxID=1858805 RepID=M5GAQ7_DACPD|nr:uncharacterized protein DACRYDRAFT_112781 [Dacryopinax primogenitus]EJU05959.1 hypothetical protein DACRYDRAFT_112781 [Dacryopinax primogenitus]